MESISSTRVTHCVNQSKDEEQASQDESWEWENEWAEPNSEDNVDWIFDEVVETPISPIVKTLISFLDKHHSSFVTALRSIHVNEMVRSEIGTGQQHYCSFEPHGIVVQISHENGEKQCR